MTKEEVKQILEINNSVVKKHYGQNFLIDDNILKKIIAASILDKTTNVIEIGPGVGSLTDYLSKECQKVLCYEIDEQMVKILNDKKYHNVLIIQDDFLKRSLASDINKYFNNEKVKIVANLPYYITTPILLKILEEFNDFDEMIIMLQKEVAMRICGKPQTKDYNALSVLIQYYTSPKLLFDVKPSSFYPAPNVDSSVISIKHLDKIYHCDNVQYFLEFNRAIFSNRRKTIVNNLEHHYHYSKQDIINILNNNNFNPTIRAEALPVEDIVKLANLFNKNINK